MLEKDNLLDLSDNRSSDLKSDNSNNTVNVQIKADQNQEIKPQNPARNNSPELNNIKLKPNLDITQPLNETQKPIIETPTYSVKSSPEKSSLWKIILIIIVVGCLGYGGYYLYTNYFASPEKQYEKALKVFKKGPNLQSINNENRGITYFSNNLGIIFYIKNDKIYSKLLSSNEENPIVDIYNADLVSVGTTNYGDYAIIYFGENPTISENDTVETKTVKDGLKDSANNFYIVNLSNNKIEKLGQNLSNFVWTQDNIFFENNQSELLTYDFRVANYIPPVYQGPIIYYYKVIDLPTQLIYMSRIPGTNNLYLILNNESNNSSNLVSLDTSTKKITVLLKTDANALSFSPSGKYLQLFNSNSKNLSIYDSTTNKIINSINGDVIYPYELGWSEDEKSFYYYSLQSDYFKPYIKNSNRIETEGVYTDLKSFNLDNSEQKIVLTGLENNIASPKNIFLDWQNSKIYFTTIQNNNINIVNLKEMK